MTSPLVAAVDIGGTSVKAGLVAQDGRIVDRFRLPTAEFSDPRALVARLSAEIRQRLDGAPLAGIGVGAPNGNALRGTLEHPPNLPWPGVTPFAEWMTAALGARCVLTNDANAAALGERQFGAARGLDHFLFVTLGTGVGSGIVSGGALVLGHDGFAGEIGHVIVEPGGRACGCGRRGCLETLASAPGFERTYAEASGATASGEMASGEMASGERVSAPEVFARAARGEAPAQEAIERTAQVLGLALANSVAYTEPEAIFLFGGLAEAGEALLSPVRRHLGVNLLNIYQGKVSLRASGLPAGDAALLGAASLIYA